MTEEGVQEEAARRELLRERSDDGHTRVTFVELFFDLVFVFAVTQLSHLLIEHLTLGGALRTLLLLLAVWWVWIFTSWVTNWLDPDATSVRLMIFALMLGGLILSASIPKAFEERGLWFASAYAAMQIGRSLYTVWALRGHSPANHRNFQRITMWLVASGVLWILGGFAEGETRLALWTAAIAMEVISPALGFWTPGLGRSKPEDWDVAGDHLAERCGLFIIIALGESVLLTGVTFAGLEWSAAAIAAFCVCVIGSIAMWWIYFNIGAARATQVITDADTPGELARLAYTYVQVIVVAGIIVSAAADEILLKHFDDARDVATSLVLVGGPALFLAGCLLFKWVTAGWPPLSHMMGLGMLALLLAIGGGFSTLTLGAAATLVLVIVAVWETVSLKDEAQAIKDHAVEKTK
jgi:low temperature requirement protein LtrA